MLVWMEKIEGRKGKGWERRLNKAEWIDRGNEFVRRAREAVVG
jgi:hypothetical protein